MIGDRTDFALIVRIFAHYATGTVGAASIAAELAKDGVRNKSGRPWTAQVILNILRNRCYVGEVYWRGEWFESAEPFIDPAVFAASRPYWTSGARTTTSGLPPADPSTS